LAHAIKEKEIATWRNPANGEVRKPFIRISDNNPIVLNDLQVLHGLTFLPTAKDNADAGINYLRMLISQKKIIINPRCKHLIMHLKYATWNKSRTDFERDPDTGHHSDFLDALRYLVRNVNFHKNPFPSNYDMPNRDDIFRATKTVDQRNVQDNIKNWFKRK
jgi:hypothetical protein